MKPLTRALLLRPLRMWQFWTLATVAAAVPAGVAWDHHMNAAPVVAIPAPAPLPHPNAYDDFARAIALHREPPAKYGKDGKRFPVTPAQAEAVIARNEAALAALRVGFTHVYQKPTVRRADGIASGGRDEAGLRSLARTLAFETQHRAERGDVSGAITCGLDGVQMGVMSSRGGGDLDGLVGVELEEVATRQIEPLVSRLDAKQATAAALRLAAIDAQRTPLSDLLCEKEARGLMERRQLLSGSSVTQAFQKQVLPDVDSRHETTTPFDSHKMFRDWGSLLRLSKQQIVDDYHAWMQAQIAAADLPYPVATGAPLPILDLFNQAEEGVSEFALDYHSSLLEDAKARTNTGLLTTMLALRAYRLQNGGYPASLDALVAKGILKSVPADPFAPTAGTPFRYRPLANDTYLLYSVGPDGVDDGGRSIGVMYMRPDIRWHNYLTSDSKGDWTVEVNVGANSAE